MTLSSIWLFANSSYVLVSSFTRKALLSQFQAVLGCSSHDSIKTSNCVYFLFRFILEKWSSIPRKLNVTRWLPENKLLFIPCGNWKLPISFYKCNFYMFQSFQFLYGETKVCIQFQFNHQFQLSNLTLLHIFEGSISNILLPC